MDGPISIRGRYLFRPDGTRFFVRGIALPAPPPQSSVDPVRGYISLLEQLASLDLRYNVVRMYRMNPVINYGEFFRAAAELGISVIVPLTDASGPGALDRSRSGPRCYPPELYEYGVRCLRSFGRYRNVLAGVVGNEVVDGSAPAWGAAPCVRAYARDLRTYMEREMDRRLPLLYAARDSGFGAAATDSEMMRLTAEYLTCRGGAGEPSGVDVFGVNVESWCSPETQFEQNPDGTPGAYYSLWESLQHTSVPVIFSEMGCSHADYAAPEGIRDWSDVSVVLRIMSDVWSGFVAYAYDDRRDDSGFRMFNGGPWDGMNALEPTKDFFNFRDHLKHSEWRHGSAAKKSRASRFPQCVDVEAELWSCYNVRLHDLNDMPSYYSSVRPALDDIQLRFETRPGQRETGMEIKADHSNDEAAGKTEGQHAGMNIPAHVLAIAAVSGFLISWLAVSIWGVRQRHLKAQRAKNCELTDSPADTKYGSIVS